MAQTISARFPAPEQARAAMDALQRAGIDGHDISLFGASIDAAEGRPRERERAGVHHVAIRVAAGGVIGTAVGAILGLVAGGVLYGFPPQRGSGFLAIVIGGALAAGAVGAVAMGVFSADLAERWELTFGHTSGEAIVAVHPTDPAQVDHARRVLESHGGRDLRLAEQQRRATG